MDVRTAAVRRASELLGGQRNTRKYFGVSTFALSLWLAGAQPPPTEIFLKAVDIIVGQEVKELRAKGHD
jgi:hypothetical protein